MKLRISARVRDYIQNECEITEGREYYESLIYTPWVMRLDNANKRKDGSALIEVSMEEASDIRSVCLDMYEAFSGLGTVPNPFVAYLNAANGLMNQIDKQLGWGKYYVRPSR